MRIVISGEINVVEELTEKVLVDQCTALEIDLNDLTLNS